MLGRISISDFDITVVTPKELRSQALSDLLAEFPFRVCEPLYEDLPCEEILRTTNGILPSMFILLIEEVEDNSSVCS